jgi:4-hydroxy-tetrahydrodipicolinate synthase
LTEDERREFLATVIKVAAGSVRVTAQVGAMTTAAAVEGAAHAQELGADAVIAICPYYEGLDEREIEGYYRAIAEVGLPVMLYNNPYVTGWSMRPEFVARLAQIDGVDFIKDTTADAVDRIFRIHQLCGDTLEYISGMDTLAFSAFTAGVRAAVWGAANATPEACVRLWELTVRDEEYDKARALWRAFYPVNRFFEESGYCAVLRATCIRRGVDLGRSRPPVLPFDESLLPELEDLLGELEATMQALESTSRTGVTG